MEGEPAETRLRPESEARGKHCSRPPRGAPPEGPPALQAGAGNRQEDRCPGGDEKSASTLARLAWLPIPLLLAAIIAGRAAGLRSPTSSTA